MCVWEGFHDTLTHMETNIVDTRVVMGAPTPTHTHTHTLT